MDVGRTHSGLEGRMLLVEDRAGVMHLGGCEWLGK